MVIDGWNYQTGKVIRAKADSYDTVFVNRKGVTVNQYLFEDIDSGIYLNIRYAKGCNLVSAAFSNNTYEHAKRLSNSKYKIYGFHIPTDDELREYMENHHIGTWEAHWSKEYMENNNFISGLAFRGTVLVSDYKLEVVK